MDWAETLLGGAGGGGLVAATVYLIGRRMTVRHREHVHDDDVAAQLRDMLDGLLQRERARCDQLERELARAKEALGAMSTDLAMSRGECEQCGRRVEMLSEMLERQKQRIAELEEQQRRWEQLAAKGFERFVLEGPPPDRDTAPATDPRPLADDYDAVPDTDPPPGG